MKSGKQNKFHGTGIERKLLNTTVKEYRLTKKQQLFYTDLFNENSTNGKVKKEDFMPLLGVLGTEFAQDFSDRMFLVLSKGQNEITLEQYLRYIDTYYCGDIHERCLYTCNLMDTEQKGNIDLKDFSEYINMIIKTVKKVNNTLSSTVLMSEKDIESLFYHISKGQPSFTYEDFENTYMEKPELVSWFDYFKHDKEDMLLIINKNLLIIIEELYKFLCCFIGDLFHLFDKDKEINLEQIFQNVLNYNNKLEETITNFQKKISKFKYSSIFSNLKGQMKFITELQNKPFEYNKQTKYTVDDKKTFDELFKNIKRQIYQKDEKEILLSNKERENLMNNNILFQNFLERSKTFREKNFKFNDVNELKLSPKSINVDLNKNTNNLKNINININPKINNFNNNNNINIIPTNNSVKIINLNNPQNIYINNNLNINNYNMNNNINQNNIYNQNNYNNYLKNPIQINTQNNFPTPNSPISANKSFYGLKETQKLKQLLFFSRVVIEKALEVSIIFNICYKWVSENYLAKSIKKIKREEKTRKENTYARKNSRINKPKKMAPIKKKIIGASEKSFEILFNMIMGIQIAVQAVPNFKIKNRDDIKKYLTKMIYSIQTIYLGNDKEEAYLLKEFAGVIFNNIRSFFGINKESFIKSISPQDFITEVMISSKSIFEELCSTGKSGSLLYYTRDGEFIVKTISKNEYRFLKTMIDEYYFYLKENPISFLPKLLGCYVLQRKYKKKITNIYFIVMTNVFATTHSIDIRFDLKGSKIGRKVLKGKIIDIKQEISKNGDRALKDLDFDRFGEKVYVGEKRDIILTQFRKDIDFLQKINSNDYSLLLGIHSVRNEEKLDLLKPISIKTNDDKIYDNQSLTVISKTHETESNKSYINDICIKYNRKDKKFNQLYDFDDLGILSQNHQRIYYLGIIDILTKYGCGKHIEYFFKQFIYCSQDMSCVPPEYYKQRFFQYLSEIFVKDEISNNGQINNNYNFNASKFSSINSSINYQTKNPNESRYIEDSFQNL